jgi:transcriptional regulator with XRE-family HTH domain
VARGGDQTFGQAVRELREARNLSQERLGQLAELHRNYIGGVERGELNPTLRTIKRIAGGLGVAGSELLAHAERLEHVRRET